jgi:hypothetical protein
MADLKSLPGSADIAKTLNAQYAAVVAGGIVLKAIEFGHSLNRTKRDVGYGLWGSWVAANCKFTERTAFRYINLAEKQDKLPLKDQTRMSELTLNEALRLVADPTVKKVQDPHKAVEAVDRATKALLENLWKLDPSSAGYKIKAVMEQLQELSSKRVEPVQKAAA